MRQAHLDKPHMAMVARYHKGEELALRVISDSQQKLGPSLRV